MKRIMIFLILGLFTFLPASVMAQEPRQALTLDVLLPPMAVVSRAAGEMAWIPLNVKYQRVVREHLVLMVKAGLNYSWGPGEKILEVYPMLALEWHPFGTGLKGFHLGPSLLLSYCHYWNDYAVVDNPDHNTRIAPGLNLGWQFVLRSKVVIDLTFGMGYGFNAEVDRNGKTTKSFSLDESIAGVFVGYAF